MIFRSNFPDVDIEKIGIYQFITSNPYGIDDDKVIFIDGITDKKLTFGQLKTNSKKLAFGLKKKVGFKHGDVLAICSHNHIDYPVVIFGAIATGGIVTTVNPDYEYEEFASQLKDCEYTPEEAESTTAYLCYSSGTTGKSKGIEITHFNMVSNLTQINVFEDQINHENIFMGSHGASCVILCKFKFELETFCRIIQDYKVNIAPIVPPIIWLLVNKINLIKGLTEATPFATATKTHEIVDGSIGILIPNMECKVISEDNKELGYNKSGEFCFRGPNIMKGYLNNEKATDACIDSDGWFHTGDFGFVDPQGNFFIVDRFNELIKYKKYRIIPTELESILLTHSSINDSAVIGIYSDEQETEYPLAYVELKPDKIQSDQLKEEIKDFVSQKVDPYKKLHCVHFIDKIPKSSAGKTLRRSLRAKNECVKQCLL
ncbi:unnamed protein product [Rhizophagus irregularis]|nr:unnamed protein product [Rhizophagus irregularis]